MQTEKKVMIVVAIMVVAAVVGIFIFGSLKTSQDAKLLEESKTSALKTNTQYALSEISTHNNAKSCWVIIDNFVYDMTPFINLHPGGEKAIIGVCGTDGTATFNGVHDNSGKTRKMALLQKYLVGVLKP